MFWLGMLTQRSWDKFHSILLLYPLLFALAILTMMYQYNPLMIPVLAAGYVSTVYLLLMLAKRTAKVLRSKS